MKKKILLSILASSILVAQNIEIEEITVTTAANTKQSLENTTANVSVITKAELDEKNFTTVTEALNTVAGINYSSNGGLGQATSVYVRGLSSKRVLVLIDGVRYNDVTGLNGAQFENLMLDDIEQIEIVKGAQSGVWGADATAGVINIITTKAKDGLHGSILAEYGSFNTYKIGAKASYKTDKFYLQASTQKLDSDGFSALVPNGDDIDDYEDDGYENITTNLKLGFNINATNKIDISHTIIDTRADFDGYDPVTFAPDPNSPDYSKTYNTFSQINFNHIDSFNEIDIYAKLSKFEREYPLSSFTTKYEGDTKEYGIKSTIKYNEEDFLIVGADYKKFTQDDGSIDRDYDNTAGFITNSNIFDLVGKTIVSESLRYDEYDSFDNKMTGKVGIKHFFNGVDGLSASANLGTAYNVPTMYQLYDTYSGNQNLKPEETTSYDLTISYKDIQVTYFNSSTKDMLDYDYSTYTYNNLDGRTDIQGIELGYDKEIFTDILLNLNYTWLDAKNNANQELGRRPKDTIKMGVDYYAITRTHLGVYGEYIGERYDRDNKQGKQTGKYTVVNLVANYDINKNFSLYAKVDNLFDKYYQVVDGYATAPLSAYAGLKAKF